MQTANSLSLATTPAPAHRSQAAMRLHGFLLAIGFCMAQALPTLVQAQPTMGNESALTVSTISMLPIASVVAVVQPDGRGSQNLERASDTASKFVVKGVEVSTDGVVYVLEGASDGVRVSIKMASQVAVTASIVVGTVIVLSTTPVGLVVSVAGVAIAFIPNDQGKVLLHNEKVSP